MLSTRLPPHPLCKTSRHQHLRKSLSVDPLLPHRLNPDSQAPTVLLRTYRDQLQSPSGLLPEPHPLQHLHGPAGSHRQKPWTKQSLLHQEHPADSLSHRRTYIRKEQLPQWDENSQHLDEGQLPQTDSDKIEVFILRSPPSAWVKYLWPAVLGASPPHQPTTHATSASSLTTHSQ